jgi:hypothetical protein
VTGVADCQLHVTGPFAVAPSDPPSMTPPDDDDDDDEQ